MPVVLPRNDHGPCNAQQADRPTAADPVLQHARHLRGTGDDNSRRCHARIQCTWGRGTAHARPQTHRTSHSNTNARGLRPRRAGHAGMRTIITWHACCHATHDTRVARVKSARTTSHFFAWASDRALRAGSRGSRAPQGQHLDGKLRSTWKIRILASCATGSSARRRSLASRSAMILSSTRTRSHIAALALAGHRLAHRPARCAAYSSRSHACGSPCAG